MVDVSLPAFIASCSKTADTISTLLSSDYTPAFLASLKDAVQTWKSIGDHLEEPTSPIGGSQKSWDSPVAELHLKRLIGSPPDDLTRGRLLSVSGPKAGSWLNATTITSLGLKLDNESLQISVGLRVGAKLNLEYK